MLLVSFHTRTQSHNTFYCKQMPRSMILTDLLIKFTSQFELDISSHFLYIISVANALFHVYVGVGDYTLPLDHSLLVRSDICHLGYHGDTWDYVWCT